MTAMTNSKNYEQGKELGGYQPHYRRSIPRPVATEHLVVMLTEITALKARMFKAYQVRFKGL